MNFKRLFICFFIVCGAKLFGANDGAGASHVSVNKEEQANPLWEAFRQSEYYEFYKTSSDEREQVKEDAKDAHAEVDTVSTSDGSRSSSHSACLTPPAISRKEEIVDYMDMTDRIMVSKMNQFCQSTVLMHDVVTYLLQEQRCLKMTIEVFQGELITLRGQVEKNGALIDYVADKACHLTTCRHNREKMVISINALNEKCKELDKQSADIEKRCMIEYFEMRQRIDNLTRRCAQINVFEAHLQRIEQMVENLEWAHYSSSSGSAAERRRVTSQPQKRLTPTHSDTQGSISPFTLGDISAEVHDENSCPQSPEEERSIAAIPMLSLEVPQSTQKLLEEAGDTAI